LLVTLDGLEALQPLDLVTPISELGGQCVGKTPVVFDDQQSPSILA
jgi:hypothetical protein